MTATPPADVHPLVRAWISQLLSPEITALLAVAGDGQIDVKLSAAKGKVRMRPAIVVNGGPQSMVEP